jgi:hypothetical protein
MNNFEYEPPIKNDHRKKSFTYSKSNDLLQNYMGDEVSAVLKNFKRQNNLIDNNKRDEIITYVLDNKRAFNYSRKTVKYIPYNVPKDAYDLFFYNYGFQ